MQYTDEYAFEKLKLDIYFAEEGESADLYEDSGDGYEYQKGEYAHRNFSTLTTNTTYIINQTILGDYDSCYQQFDMVFHGFPAPNVIMVDGENMTPHVESSDNLYKLTVPKNFKEILLTIAS